MKKCYDTWKPWIIGNIVNSQGSQEIFLQFSFKRIQHEWLGFYSMSSEKCIILTLKTLKRSILKKLKP